MTSKSTNWLEFEKLVQAIQKSLAPEGQVTHNEFLKGKSNVEHQCDVVLRSKVGQFSFLCVIECKQWKKRVGLEVVKGFVSKVNDIGAHHGMIVSEIGFSRKALKFAKQNNIALCKPIDAQSKVWENVGLIPIQVTCVRQGTSSFKISASEQFGTTDTIGKQISEEAVVVFDKKKKQSLNLRQLYEQKWDELFSEKMPADKGTLQGTDEGRFLLDLKNGKPIPVTFEYNFGIETTYYYNRVSLKECKGFLNEHTGELITDRLETSPMLFKDIINTWPSTKNQEGVPFKAVLYLWVVQKFSEEHENMKGLVLHASIKPPIETDSPIFRVNGLKVR
jgi:hypothetical protein